MLGVDGAGETHDCCVDEDEGRGQGVMVLAKGQMRMRRCARSEERDDWV
jgi:hypothetical protein